MCILYVYVCSACVCILSVSALRSPPGQIDKKLKSLERCQSLEEIQRFFESGDYDSVVRLLRPTLSYGGSGRIKALDFVSSVPERPAQLLLLQVRRGDGRGAEGMMGGVVLL